MQCLEGLDREKIGDADRAEFRDAARSLRIRSTIIRFSARLLMSVESMWRTSRSPSWVPARGAVPFIGRVEMARPCCSMKVRRRRQDRRRRRYRRDRRRRRAASGADRDKAPAASRRA